LKLHEWDVDFAAWCTYKYLNSGAGSIGGIFLHQKHFDANLKKLDGWWSHKAETRFQMSNSKNLFLKLSYVTFVLNLFQLEMEYANGAASYAMSNPSPGLFFIYFDLF